MHSENERGTQQAVLGDEKDDWKTSMRNEIESLDKMKCWDIVPRSKSDRVMHLKFVLEKKRGDKREVKRYKPRFVLCGNEEDDKEETSFSPVRDFTTIKLIMCIAKMLETKEPRLSKRFSNWQVEARGIH